LKHDAFLMNFGLDSFSLIFDVGANMGQTAVVFAALFPHAETYSLEPVAGPLLPNET
jgi:hypothetical protein